MPLTNTQIRYLKAQAHQLKPVVMVGGNGVSDNLMEEIDNALRAHELIKIKIRAEERDERDQIIDHLCRQSGAEKVQRIGHNLTLYRHNPKKPKYTLPK